MSDITMFVMAVASAVTPAATAVVVLGVLRQKR